MFRLFLFLALFSSSIIAADDLPSLGATTSGITHEQEAAIGQAWLRALRRQVPTYEELLFRDYLNERVSQLVAHSRLVPPEYTTVVVDSKDLNAFAVPGGIIGINTGLMLYVESEDELLSVLAHEIGHLTQRHFTRLKESQQALQRVQLTSLLTAIILMQSNPELGQATWLAGTAGAIAQQLKYSRNMEQEADRIGQEILARSGFRVSAMPAMLERMQKMQTLSGNQPPEYLLTHPVTERRISDTRQYARQQKFRWRNDSLEFYLHKLTIRLRYLKDKNQIWDELDHQRKIAESPEQIAAVKFVQARYYAVEKRWQEGLSAINEARRMFPVARTLRYLEVKLLWGDDQREAAMEMARQLYQDFPNSLSSNYLYGDILIETKQWTDGLQIFRSLSRKYPQQPEVWERLAVLETQSDNKWNAFRANNELLWLTGQESKAIRQLEFALQSDQWRGIERSRMADRLLRMRSERETARF